MFAFLSVCMYDESISVCLYVGVSVCGSVCMWECLSVCGSVYQYVCVKLLCVNMSVCLCEHLSVCMFICKNVCFPFCLHFHPSVWNLRLDWNCWLPICLSLCMFIGLFGCLFVGMFCYIYEWRRSVCRSVCSSFCLLRHSSISLLVRLQKYVSVCCFLLLSCALASASKSHNLSLFYIFFPPWGFNRRLTDKYKQMIF